MNATGLSAVQACFPELIVIQSAQGDQSGGSEEGASLTAHLILFPALAYLTF